MFCDLPGFLVCCLTINMEKFLVIIASDISSVPFYLSSSSGSPILHILHFLVVLQFLGILFGFVFQSLFAF